MPMRHTSQTSSTSTSQLRSFAARGHRRTTVVVVVVRKALFADIEHATMWRQEATIWPSSSDTIITRVLCVNAVMVMLSTIHKSVRFPMCIRASRGRNSFIHLDIARHSRARIHSNETRPTARLGFICAHSLHLIRQYVNKTELDKCAQDALGYNTSTIQLCKQRRGVLRTTLSACDHYAIMPS